MVKFFPVKSKREFVFVILSAVFILILLAYTVFSLSFLANKLRDATNISSNGEETVTRFDFSKLEELKRKK